VGGVLFMAVLVSLAGCRVGNYANENDTLRAKVVDLESQIDQLKRRNAELEAQARSIVTAPITMSEDVRLNMPQAAELSIDKLSFVRDSNKDGIPDMLTLYLKPVDGLGRFVQIVGTIDVTVAVIPLKGEPATIGKASLGPAEVREAYRSGFTGTHYTIDVPIVLPTSNGVESCVVKIEFHDGLTGRTMTADRTIALK
jgi:hypothetical protein